MKRIQDIINQVKTISVVGGTDVAVRALIYDSRQVETGDCFVAIVGTQSDGHNYIDSAIESGAKSVVCECLPKVVADGVTYIQVGCSSQAMGVMAAALYDHPSRELELIGITGTNGKTTTATLLYNLVRSLGFEAGLISTVDYRIGDKVFDSTHTTPDSVRINEMLREMVSAGCQYCFMECSSHAMTQHRVEGLEFRGALFSNITHDHLDYHKSFLEYINAKKMLFDALSPSAFAIVNGDDRNGRVMLQNCRAKHSDYSLRQMAQFRAKILEMSIEGMLLRIDGSELWVQHVGRFNAYNLLAVYATARELGLDKEEVLRAMTTLSAVAGRFEIVRSQSGRVAIVDYAHTPDALESVLQTIEEYRTHNEQLIVVCGCGGDRDRTKRSAMGEIAVRYASTAIFTSDNPRSESVDKIIDDMCESLDSGARYLRITDRGEAIRTAVMLSNGGDIILLAGKGHEKYQIVGDKKFHFDDKECIEEEFKNLDKTR